MNEIMHATGTRLLKLREKLAAREGLSGYEKNCEAIREEIARLENVTARSVKSMRENHNADQG